MLSSATYASLANSCCHRAWIRGRL